MSQTNEMTDSALLTELGNRLAQHRLRRNLTQAKLALESGVSKRTLIRLENGESSQVKNLLRVLRTLGLLANLDVFVPTLLPSPIEQLRSRTRMRHRASPNVKANMSPNKWTWRDEPPKAAGES